MEKRILIFEDDKLYVQLLRFRIDDFIEKNDIDLQITDECCTNYCEAIIKINEIERTRRLKDYNLIIIDLKLPFAAERPEKKVDEKFIGLELARLIRQKFSDKIRYLPITSLLSAVKNLDPALHDVDQIDIDRTMDKTVVSVLTAEIINILTQK